MQLAKWIWSCCAAALLAQSPEERLAAFDAMPDLIRARAWLRVASEPGLNPELSQRLAKEGFEMAQRLEQTLEVKDYPLALRWAGPPENLMGEAWRVAQSVGLNLPFPLRTRSVPARCDHTAIEDLRPYLRAAYGAGPEVLTRVLPTLRSPLEIEAALDILSQWDDERAVAMAVPLVRRLRQATLSRAEFEAARNLEGLVRRLAARVDEETREQMEADYVYFRARNREIVACPADADTPAPTFQELKLKLLGLAEEDRSGYSFLETMLALRELAGDDQSRINELEATGNVRVTQLAKLLRQGRKR